MLNKNHRVLWLLNHETLREFEVPLLRKLGYEVYLPKHFPETEANLSASIDYSYDPSLTIPVKALEILNRHDFYSKKIPQEVANIINRYFSAAIFAFFPFLFEQLVDVFMGKLFFRCFGLAGGATYSRLSHAEYFSSDFPERILSVKERFFFAQSYPFLSEVEEGIMRERALTLPLGFPDSFWKAQDSWKGGNSKLLFVCPRINSSPYYKNIYTNFKNCFSDSKHVIAGKQLEAVEDPFVCGSLPRKEYDELLQHSEVMFYHLEAAMFGLPLIYMSGGMLNRFTDIKLPGSADTYEEARKKVQRILAKDEEFIKEVVCSQRSLLDSFQQRYCEEMWQKNFCNVLEEKYAVST